MADVSVARRVGSEVRDKREEMGWSLAILAEKASISRSMIHKIESGTGNPTITLLAKLAGAFNIPLSGLVSVADLHGARVAREVVQPVWQNTADGVS